MTARLVRRVALVTAAVLLAGTVAVTGGGGAPTTRAGFTASVTDPSGTTGTAQSFRCAGSTGADRDGALFTWPLDDAEQARQAGDSFTGPTSRKLEDHTGDTGTTWAKLPTGSGLAQAALSGDGRVRKGGTSSQGNAALYRSSLAPSSADYTVTAVVHQETAQAAETIGVVARLDETDTAGTYYSARYEQAERRWALAAVVGGTRTVLGTAPGTLVDGGTARVSLDLAGTRLRLLVDGVEVVVLSDSRIAGPGRVGISMGDPARGAYDVSTTRGMLLDDFGVQQVASNAGARDVSGRSATGRRLGSHVLGPPVVGGGCPRDGGGATVLDGAASAIVWPTQQSDPQTFSVELWVRTTVDGGRLIGFGDRASGPSTTTDRHLYVDAAGRVVLGVRPVNVQTVTSPGRVDDDRWHHVVGTFSRSTGLRLHVDGVRVASDPSVTSARSYSGYWRVGYDDLGTGWPSVAGSALAGQVRWASAYSVVLTDEQVRQHWASGR